MTLREIKFTSFGVPYVLEFENVSFVPEQQQQRSPSPSSSTSSFCHIDSPSLPTRPPLFSFHSPASLFKRKPSPGRRSEHPLWCTNPDSTKPLPPPPSQSDASETLGICIRFPPGHRNAQTTRKERLAHLQQTISTAVLDAGMSRSPEKHSNGNAVHGNRGYRTPNALFCGTYGQMMAALEGAGLSATPCSREDLHRYTRLGALFVARNDGSSGVQLRKITLLG